ncbi:hypothetical protein ALTERO38_20443 [Alteromonas sp. 38]|nr:hypothetical protein ALTER154_100093 [Alteromonas sp. 154]VXB10480.1 hypothetical protein ALTERO38_20443 [Alteromonas sp. 38]
MLSNIEVVSASISVLAASTEVEVVVEIAALLDACVSVSVEDVDAAAVSAAKTLFCSAPSNWFCIRLMASSVTRFDNKLVSN